MSPKLKEVTPELFPQCSTLAAVVPPLSVTWKWHFQSAEVSHRYEWVCLGWGTIISPITFPLQLLPPSPLPRAVPPPYRREEQTRQRVLLPSGVSVYHPQCTQSLSFNGSANNLSETPQDTISSWVRGSMWSLKSLIAQWLFPLWLASRSTIEKRFRVDISEWPHSL